MIKFTNYNQETQNIDWTKHPAILHKAHKELMPLAQEGAYNGDADVKRVVDAHIAILNAALSEKKEKPKVPIPVLPQKRAVKTTTKPKNETKKSNEVERISDEVVLIKRYVNFNGKECSKAGVINLLKAVQKAILEKRVSKTSRYGAEIMQIQGSLISLANDKATTFKINFSDSLLKQYHQIVNNTSPMASIALLKRYITLLGKKDIKDKVKRLKSDFQRAFDKDIVTRQDKYFSQFNYAFENMKQHLQGRSEVLSITKTELTGFKGLGFIPQMIAVIAGGAAQALTYHHLSKNKALSGTDDEVMSVEDAKNETFKEIGLTGDLRKLIGAACIPTSLFIYGNGGSGKSSLSLKLADDLHNKAMSILYIAGEQFGTPTFKELLKKTNVAGGDNFKIVKTLTALPISDYDVIVIDSKESVNMDNSQDFKALRDMYPDKIYIITSQGTKSGNFRGDEKWKNEVDTMIYCEKGIASTLEQKNRWGGKAEIKLF